MATYNPLAKNRVALVGESVVATEPTLVHIPEEYSVKGLVKITSYAECVGLFNIIIGGEYFVISSPLMYTLPYRSVSRVTVDDEPYIQLEFDKGDRIIESLTVATNAVITVEMLTFLLLRGQMPYFVTSEINLNLLKHSSKVAGINLDENSALLEILATLSQRQQEDSHQFYRHNPVGKVKYISLNDVNFGTFSTFSRLLNGHQASALITSLTTDKVSLPSKLEKTLRR
jgi:hypothetical protein